MSSSSPFHRPLLTVLTALSVVGCHYRGELRSTTPANTPGSAAIGPERPAPFGGTARNPATGAVVRDIPEGSVTVFRTEDLFTHRFPGLEVRRTADGRLSMLLRGREPLVVVDGLEADASLLEAVQPSTVERIEVLRNASETAIYGSRGRNGVVVVTTRR